MGWEGLAPSKKGNQNQMDIRKFCEEGLALAEEGIAGEGLSGNVVKEAEWRGEAVAYRAVLSELGTATTSAPATQGRSAQDRSV